MAIAPTVQFEFVLSPGLPRLAWCVEWSKCREIVTVTHGDWVETTKECFFEGAWSDDVGHLEFDRHFMTGTGAIITHDGLLLVTPNHTLDRINVLRNDAGLYASNSLPFLLSMAHDSLDMNCLFYDSYITSIKDGLKRSQRSIGTNSKSRVDLHYYCNVLIRPNCDVVIVPKTSGSSFATFNEYRTILLDVAATIAQNASDPRRKVQYLPMTTISSGYDSVATSVVAVGVGCKDAVTFRDTRTTSGTEDCGTEIGRHLNLNVHEFGRLDYRKNRSFSEAENSGGPGEFNSFKEILAGRLLFTGFHGDGVWNKNAEVIARDLVRSDASGSSMTEFRLRTGFCHFPVPFVRADDHPSLHTISNSEEMEPWSLHNKYDRPIPRRLAEEAGVTRTSFGQKKRAAGVVVSQEGLANTLSEESYADFERFLDKHWNWRTAGKARLVKVLRWLLAGNLLFAKVVMRAARTAKIQSLRVPIAVPGKLRILTYGYVGKESLLFHWGVAKMLERYESVSGNARCRGSVDERQQGT